MAPACFAVVLRGLLRPPGCFLPIFTCLFVVCIGLAQRMMRGCGFVDGNVRVTFSFVCGSQPCSVCSPSLAICDAQSKRCHSRDRLVAGWVGVAGVALVRSCGGERRFWSFTLPGFPRSNYPPPQCAPVFFKSICFGDTAGPGGSALPRFLGLLLVAQ
jgi:hypothetical protein